MNKNDCFEKLDEIAEYKDGWSNYGNGYAFSKLLIERCRRMAEQMNIVPEIMPTVEDEICFQYDTEDIGIEIAVSNEEISGFVSDNSDNTSLFVFETETDAVNFWNIIVGGLAESVSKEIY